MNPDGLHHAHLHGGQLPSARDLARLDYADARLMQFTMRDDHLLITDAGRDLEAAPTRGGDEAHAAGGSPSGLSVVPEESADRSAPAVDLQLVMLAAWKAVAGAEIAGDELERFVSDESHQLVVAADGQAATGTDVDLSSGPITSRPPGSARSSTRLAAATW